MSYPTTPANVTPLLDRPIYYPVRLVAKPVLFVISKISGIVQVVLGYLVRIGVFSFGEWNRSYFKKKIIDCYKGGCYDTHERNAFNPFRLEQAFGALTEVGGVRFNSFSKDGTRLDTMLIRYRDIVKKVEEKGGKVVNAMPVWVDDEIEKNGQLTIYCKENHNHPNKHFDLIIPESEDEEWGTFYNEVLLSLGLQKIVVELINGKKVEGILMHQWPEKNPPRPKPGLHIRSNAPTESYAMAKRDILRRVLGLKSDVLAYDYRGTWKSEGVPTEGGYYIDAETMVDMAVDEFGYQFNDIWADGFCLGSGVAVHLLRKYHDKGINLIIQNGFDSLLNTTKEQMFPAKYLAPLGLGEVKSRDPKICSLVAQDSFDSVGKIRALGKKERKGTSIIINTDTDTTIHPLSHDQLSAVIDRISKTSSIMYSPKGPIRHRNGHSLDVLADPDTWRKTVQLITAKDYPEILERTAKWHWPWS